MFKNPNLRPIKITKTVERTHTRTHAHLQAIQNLTAQNKYRVVSHPNTCTYAAIHHNMRVYLRLCSVYLYRRLYCWCVGGCGIRIVNSLHAQHTRSVRTIYTLAAWYGAGNYPCRIHSAQELSEGLGPPESRRPQTPTRPDALSPPARSRGVSV